MRRSKPNLVFPIFGNLQGFFSFPLPSNIKNGPSATWDLRGSPSPPFQSSSPHFPWRRFGTRAPGWAPSRCTSWRRRLLFLPRPRPRPRRRRSAGRRPASQGPSWCCRAWARQMGRAVFLRFLCLVFQHMVGCAKEGLEGGGAGGLYSWFREDMGDMGGGGTQISHDNQGPLNFSVARDSIFHRHQGNPLKTLEHVFAYHTVASREMVKLFWDGRQPCFFVFFRQLS